jgi:hypothetical protein
VAVDSWNIVNGEIDFDKNISKILEPHILSLKHISTFTQLVWKNSTQIGCGRTNCGGQNGVKGWLVVCEFFPKGNVIGEVEANVQGSVDGKGGTEVIGSAAAPKGAGVIGPAKDGNNKGSIGKGKSNNGGRVLDRVQVWFVFVLVWLVVGAVLM